MWCHLWKPPDWATWPTSWTRPCKVCPSPPSSAVERHFAFISEEFWKLYSNYLSAARARRWSDACNWDLFLDLCWSVLEVSSTIPFKFWISDSAINLINDKPSRNVLINIFIQVCQIKTVSWSHFTFHHIDAKQLDSEVQQLRSPREVGVCTYFNSYSSITFILSFNHLNTGSQFRTSYTYLYN